MLNASSAERNKEPIAEILKLYLRDGMKVSLNCHHHSKHWIRVSSSLGFGNSFWNRPTRVTFCPPLPRNNIFAVRKRCKIDTLNSWIFGSLSGKIIFHQNEIKLRTLQHPNVRVPLFVDVSKPVSNWALPEDYAPNSVDIVLSINMIHISSDAAVIGLFEVSSYS